MSFLSEIRKQDAIWWKRGEPDRYGNGAYDAPVQIKCRWEDMFGEFRNSQGETMASRGTVYVDREMTVGDKLKKGLIDDTDTPENPDADPTAFSIQGFEIIPDFKPKPSTTLYIAHL